MEKLNKTEIAIVKLVFVLCELINCLMDKFEIQSRIAEGSFFARISRLLPFVLDFLFAGDFVSLNDGFVRIEMLEHHYNV